MIPTAFSLFLTMLIGCAVVLLFNALRATSAYLKYNKALSELEKELAYLLGDLYTKFATNQVDEQEAFEREQWLIQIYSKIMYDLYSKSKDKTSRKERATLK